MSQARRDPASDNADVRGVAARDENETKRTRKHNGQHEKKIKENGKQYYNSKTREKIIFTPHTCIPDFCCVALGID